MSDLEPLLSADELRESVSSAGYSLAASDDYERAVWTATEWVEDRCSNSGCRQWR